jgi:hypothetical protein
MGNKTYWKILEFSGQKAYLVGFACGILVVVSCASFVIRFFGVLSGLA